MPDAFTNPEYVQFAIKGTLSAFICYFLFIGFDYPGIYTSVVTCFVVSLSTIGASNQKGILRFGGAAVGGLMGLIALVYLFPNMETIGGFWLVFGAGTAVAAWANFGTPRISYAGYQTGLAFYKAILQDFGPALSATVVRDRVIGVFFGLIVFSIVEHLLWPVRAQDPLRARLAEIMRMMADLARPGTSSATAAVITPMWIPGVHGSPRKLSRVRFRRSSSRPSLSRVIWKQDEIQKLTCDAQIIFILLLSLARQSRDIAQSNVVQTAEVELDSAIATALEALAMRAAGGSEPPVPELEDALNAFKRSRAGADALDKEAAAHFAERLALYRALVAAINRLSSEFLNIGRDEHRSLSSNGERSLRVEKLESIRSS